MAGIRNDVPSVTCYAGGWMRDFYPPGMAEVLVVTPDVDCQKYVAAVPSHLNLQVSPGTKEAEQVLRENPRLRVVIIPDQSRREDNHFALQDMRACVGQSKMPGWLREQRAASQPVDDWFEDFSHTLVFLQMLERQKFGGLVIMISAGDVHDLRYSLVAESCGNLRVTYVRKSDFLDRAVEYLPDNLAASLTARERLQGALEGLRQWDQVAAQGVRRALEDLKCWEEVLCQGDPAEAFKCLASILADPMGLCACRHTLSSIQPCNRWVHQNHGLVNRAIWDLLQPKDALAGWIRVKLEEELVGSVRRIGSYDTLWCGCIRRDFGLRMRSFLTFDGPDATWLGPTVSDGN